MSYKLLIILLLLTSSFNSYAQTIEFISHSREVSTQDHLQTTPCSAGIVNLISRVTIDSMNITIQTLNDEATTKQQSTFRINKKRSYVVRNCKYWFYSCGKYLIVLDYAKHSLTIMYGKHYKPRKRPLTIIPVTVWYTRTTRIVYYGMFN